MRNIGIILSLMMLSACSTVRLPPPPVVVERPLPPVSLETRQRAADLSPIPAALTRDARGLVTRRTLMADWAALLDSLQQCHARDGLKADWIDQVSPLDLPGVD